MVRLTVPVLVTTITDGDGPTSCATCPFMKLQNALNSPQLHENGWKCLQVSLETLIDATCAAVGRLAVITSSSLWESQLISI